MTYYLTQAFNTFEQSSLENFTKKFGFTYQEFAQKHTTVNKIVTFMAHIARLAPMVAFMQVLPYSAVTNCVISLSTSLFYRVTIEWQCPLRFSLLSCFGAAAFQLAAMNSFGLLASVPLAGYAFSIIYASNIKKKSCCGS